MNQEAGMKSFVVKNSIDIKPKTAVENAIIMHRTDKSNQSTDEGWLIVGEITVLETGTEEDLGNAYRGFGATSAIKEAEENR